MDSPEFTKDGRRRLRDRPAFHPEIGVGVEYFPRFANRRLHRYGHDLVELNCVIAGQATYHLEDCSFAVGPGSLAAVHFGQTHTLVTGADGIEVYNLYIDPARLTMPPLPIRLRDALIRFLPLHPAMVHRANRISHVVFPPQEVPVSLLAMMADESRRRRPGWQQAVSLLAQQFLLACARRLLETAGEPLHISPRGDPASSRIYTVCAYLDAHLDQALHLAEVAAVAGVGPAQLARLFRLHTGTSVVTYLRQRRIERAKTMLAASNHGIAEIALTCGFGDLSHFHASFRRLAGTSPAAYRRQHHQLPA